MLQKIIPFYHQLLKQLCTPEDYVIDATCGNGNDTVFLSQIAKHVYAFDIQELAIENTKRKCSDLNLTNISLHHIGHEHIDSVVSNKVKAVVYNLGYLPHSDMTITTQKESSIESIEKALPLLEPKGIIIIALYIGHPGGKSESVAIEHYTNNLDSSKYHVLKYQFTNKIDAPYLLIIEKK